MMVLLSEVGTINVDVRPYSTTRSLNSFRRSTLLSDCSTQAKRSPRYHQDLIRKRNFVFNNRFDLHMFLKASKQAKFTRGLPFYGRSSHRPHNKQGKVRSTTWDLRPENYWGPTVSASIRKLAEIWLNSSTGTSKCSMTAVAALFKTT
jgi:hypothetical protein